MARTKLSQLYDDNQQEAETAPTRPQGPFKPKVLNPLTDGNEHLREPEGEVETVTRTPSTKKGGVTGTRHIEIAERKFRLNRHDPYGFWYIISEKGGVLPEKLQGSFTSAMEAERALTLYINTLYR